MSRDFLYDEDAICDYCGKIGAYDIMGDFFCENCIGADYIDGCICDSLFDNGD